MIKIKKIGNNKYIHKSALNQLSEKEKWLLIDRIRFISDDFEFDIVKVNLKENKVSFIQSPDFDTAEEPTVGDSYSVGADNFPKFRKGTNQIYHHKWMFVNEDYKGFNVVESKAWSEKWLNSEIVKKLKTDQNEKFNCKIGNREYFEKIKKLMREGGEL